MLPPRLLAKIAAASFRRFGGSPALTRTKRSGEILSGQIGLASEKMELRNAAGHVRVNEMTRDQVIAKLREHEPELRAAGVEHLLLHGSYARGTAISELSDIDVIAEFDPGRRLSLLDMVRIENRLADLLGVRVDLSPANTLKEPVRQNAAREAVLAF